MKKKIFASLKEKLSHTYKKQSYINEITLIICVSVGCYRLITRTLLAQNIPSYLMPWGRIAGLKGLQIGIPC